MSVKMEFAVGELAGVGDLVHAYVKLSLLVVFEHDEGELARLEAQRGVIRETLNEQAILVPSLDQVMRREGCRWWE